MGLGLEELEPMVTTAFEFMDLMGVRFAKRCITVLAVDLGRKATFRTARSAAGTSEFLSGFHFIRVAIWGIPPELLVPRHRTRPVAQRQNRFNA